MHAHTPTDLEDEQNMGKCNMLQRAILAGARSGHRFRSKNVLIGTSQSAWTKNFILQGLGTFEEFFFSGDKWCDPNLPVRALQQQYEGKPLFYSVAWLI